MWPGFQKKIWHFPGTLKNLSVQRDGGEHPNCEGLRGKSEAGARYMGSGVKAIQK